MSSGSAQPVQQVEGVDLACPVVHERGVVLHDELPYGGKLVRGQDEAIDLL